MIKSNPCPWHTVENRLWSRLEWMTRMAWAFRASKRPKGPGYDAWVAKGWDRGRYTAVRAEIAWLREIISETDYFQLGRTVKKSLTVEVMA